MRGIDCALIVRCLSLRGEGDISRGGLFCIGEYPDSCDLRIRWGE